MTGTNTNIGLVSHSARTAISLATGSWDAGQKGVALKEKVHIRRRRICKDKSAFINFMPHHDIIGGINKKATSLDVLGTGDINVIIHFRLPQVRPY